MFPALSVNFLPFMMMLNPFAFIVRESSGGAADITTFTTFATSLLQWLITTFGTVLNFMLQNPVCFVGLIMMLIVASIGMLRHLIGG